MTYHASYEQAGPPVTKFSVTEFPSGIAVRASLGRITIPGLPLLDPTAARWLANRLIEAATEMEQANG